MATWWIRAVTTLNSSHFSNGATLSNLYHLTDFYIGFSLPPLFYWSVTDNLVPLNVHYKTQWEEFLKTGSYLGGCAANGMVLGMIIWVIMVVVLGSAHCKNEAYLLVFALE